MHTSPRVAHALCGVVVTLVALSLIGCATGRRPGFPKQSLDEDTQITQLEKSFDLPTLLAEYDYAGGNRSARDRIITGKLALTDLQYNRFVSDFAFEKQTIDTVTDILVLGLSISATAVGGAGAKTLLSAISSGVTGSKLAIDKNFYYEKTVSVLVTAMNAQRKTALIPIVIGRNQSVQEYPLPQALTDLDAYYRAGTFLGALQAIQADAGAKESDADERLISIRTTQFGEDDSSRVLQKFVKTDRKALRDWMDKNGLKDISTAPFIYSKEFAARRKKAIEELTP